MARLATYRRQTCWTTERASSSRSSRTARHRRRTRLGSLRFRLHFRALGACAARSAGAAWCSSRGHAVPRADSARRRHQAMMRRPLTAVDAGVSRRGERAQCQHSRWREPLPRRRGAGVDGAGPRPTPPAGQAHRALSPRFLPRRDSRRAPRPHRDRGWPGWGLPSRTRPAPGGRTARAHLSGRTSPGGYAPRCSSDPTGSAPRQCAFAQNPPVCRPFSSKPAKTSYRCGILPLD